MDAKELEALRHDQAVYEAMVKMGKCSSLLAEGEHTDVAIGKKFFVGEGEESAEAG